MNPRRRKQCAAMSRIQPHDEYCAYGCLNTMTMPHEHPHACREEHRKLGRKSTATSSRTLTSDGAAAAPMPKRTFRRQSTAKVAAVAADVLEVSAVLSFAEEQQLLQQVDTNRSTFQLHDHVCKVQHVHLTHRPDPVGQLTG